MAPHVPRLILAVSVAILLGSSLGWGEEKSPLYKVGVDGMDDINPAIEKAKAENKRVLVEYGANWCGWCKLVDEIFTTDKAFKSLIDSEYVVVHVNSDDDKTVSKTYDFTHDTIPYLLIIDGDGKKIASEEVAIIAGESQDQAKVLAFLDTWKVEPVTAKAVYDSALESAKADKKLAFVHFGAPWCGWCHRLDALLADPAFAPTFAKHFVDVKIDTERMEGAADVQKAIKTNHGGGIPWWAVIDGDGKVLATSDAAGDQNTGYPARDEEIAHFMKGLNVPAAKLTADEAATLEAAVREKAAKL